MSANTIVPTAIDAFVAIEFIQVVDRHRHDLGDVDALAASIDDIGLLHPVVLTRKGRLVAGQRRLEACRRLGWYEVPVRFVDNLDDATQLLHAERDENVCRKDMLPSELASLGASLHDIEAQHARDRQRQAGRENGRGIASGEVSGSYQRGETRDVIGAALGVSGRTYDHLRNAHSIANDPDAPDDERQLGRDALAEMDRTGGIWSPAERLATKLRAKREAKETKVRALAEPSPEPTVDPDWTPESNDKTRAAAVRRRDLIRALAPLGHTSDQIGERLSIATTTVRRIAREENITIPADRAIGRARRRIDPNRVVRETVHALEGLAMGIGLILDDLDGLDPAEVSNWAASLAESTRTLNRLLKTMKEMAQ